MKTKAQSLESLMQQLEKTIASRSNELLVIDKNQLKIVSIDYDEAILKIEQKGKEIYNDGFSIPDEDKELLTMIICYFWKDEVKAENFGISIRKGLLITGPIGCGKTSYMTLMRLLFLQPEARFIITSCRDISIEFAKQGYNIIANYGRLNYYKDTQRVFCFDDLGAEENRKHFGNETNVMAEILLNRYDLFMAKGLLTHVTTNLSTDEIETLYGNRLRSRMREQFNLISFPNNSEDKRK